MSLKHPVERGGEGRSRFDRIAERASYVTSSPAFFVACSAIVVVWVLSFALGWPESTRSVLGDLLAAITLMLVALLKNAELRAEHAVQFKLDAIAAVLLEVHGRTDERVNEELKRAIGRHEEV